MKNIWRQTVLALLSLALLLCAGCVGRDKQIVEAKNIVQVYLTALTGFNLDAMETGLDSGSNQDMGIDTSVYESTFVQTEVYKEAVDSMYKALSGTVEFTIHDATWQDKKTVTVPATLQCADVNQAAVEEHMRAKVDAYIKEHPEVLNQTEQEQNDTSISVMAVAYEDFVQTQPRVTKTVQIVVSKMEGEWKIASDASNAELKQWLRDMFGTF